MDESGYAVFDTAIGRCGIAWRGEAVTATSLPSSSDAAVRARLLRRCPEAREAAPPPPIAAGISSIAALLGGEPRDLVEIILDMASLPELNRRVYEHARTIRPGVTTTYGEIAARLGEPRSVAPAIGKALGENPFPIVVPCHRVLAAGGRTGGFSAPGGVSTKMRMLSIEARHGPSSGLFDDLPLVAKRAT